MTLKVHHVHFDPSRPGANLTGKQSKPKPDPNTHNGPPPTFCSYQEMAIMYEYDTKDSEGKDLQGCVAPTLH